MPLRHIRSLRQRLPQPSRGLDDGGPLRFIQVSGLVAPPVAFAHGGQFGRSSVSPPMPVRASPRRAPSACAICRKAYSVQAALADDFGHAIIRRQRTNPTVNVYRSRARRSSAQWPVSAPSHLSATPDPFPLSGWATGGADRTMIMGIHLHPHRGRLVALPRRSRAVSPFPGGVRPTRNLALPGMSREVEAGSRAGNRNVRSGPCILRV